MKQPRQVEVKVETQGGPVVNDAWIIHGSIEIGIACLDINLRSKHVEIGAVSSGTSSEGPMVMLMKGEHSLHLHETASGATVIVIPDFIGWDIYCCESSRYTLRMCLVKE